MAPPPVVKPKVNSRLMEDSLFETKKGASKRRGFSVPNGAVETPTHNTGEQDWPDCLLKKSQGGVAAVTRSYPEASRGEEITQGLGGILPSSHTSTYSSGAAASAPTRSSKRKPVFGSILQQKP